MSDGSKSAGIFARLAGTLRSAGAGDPLRQSPATASAAAESPGVAAAPAAPQASAAELINEGLRQRQQLGTAAAVPFFERAAAAEPTSHLPFFMLGNAATELGDLDAAVVHYARARDLAPHDHVIHYNLGLRHFWRGYMDPAIEELAGACRRHSRPGRAIPGGARKRSTHGAARPRPCPETARRLRLRRPAHALGRSLL